MPDVNPGGLVPWPDAFARRYREAGYWRGQPLDAMLREHAERHGDRIAIVCGDRRIRYRELDERVDRRAAGLAALGLGVGDRIVVQLPNVLELVELCFAAWRIGAITVMALPGHRRAEIYGFCAHARAAAYVCADAFADGFDPRPLARELREAFGPALRVLVVGDAAEFVPFDTIDAPPRPRSPVDPGSVALLQLSGGSTGTPKLIPRTHDDYVYSVRASADVCGLDHGSVYLVALPGAHNFPLSSAGILGCLYAGGCVVMSRHAHPDAVFPLFEREGVTITAVVPALARQWLLAARTRGVSFSKLRVLQIGGAKLDASLAAELEQGLGCAIQQVFGMAEGLVCYTRLDDDRTRVLTTQGRPLSDADEIRIVDEHDRDVPEGSVGQLLTRGPYTIRGYAHAPEHNAVAFTPDGFYRTGDLVRRTPEGDLVVEGRIKEHINRAGEKIVALELEQVLVQHPSIREAAVIALPDAVLGERVCAVLVLEPGATLTRPMVHAYLREQGLATFKLPDRVERLDALPRTSVGKTDKRALVARFTAARPPR